MPDDTPDSPQKPTDSPQGPVPAPESREVRRRKPVPGTSPAPRQDLPEVPMNDEVQEALYKLQTLWTKHGGTILWTVVIVCGVLVVNNYVRQSIASAHEEAWSDLVSTTTPQGLDQVAEAYDRAGVHFKALLVAGDLYHAEALSAKADADAASDGADGKGAESGGGLGATTLGREELIERAAARYEQVVNEATGDDEAIYRINALLGLGAVRLTQERFDDAEAAYRRAMEEGESHQYLALADRARVALERLPVLREPLVLAPDPPSRPAGPTDAELDLIDSLAPGNANSNAAGGGTELDLGGGSDRGVGLDLNLDAPIRVLPESDEDTDGAGENQDESDPTLDLAPSTNPLDIGGSDTP